MISFFRRCALCICVLSLCLIAPAFAAFSGTLFAVPQTGMDGVERWGYMNESGKLVVEYSYAAADPFDESGVAAVYNDQGKAALISQLHRVSFSAQQDVQLFCIGDIRLDQKPLFHHMRS